VQTKNSDFDMISNAYRFGLLHLNSIFEISFLYGTNKQVSPELVDKVGKHILMLTLF
jgi:hypothetical protein